MYVYNNFIVFAFLQQLPKARAQHLTECIVKFKLYYNYSIAYLYIA